MPYHLHVVATYFREFRLRFYDAYGVTTTVDRMLDERCDWTNDLVKYGTEPGATRVDCAIVNDPVSQCQWAVAHDGSIDVELRRFVTRKRHAIEAGEPSALWWSDAERPLALELAFARIEAERPEAVLFTNTFHPPPAFRDRVRGLPSRVVIQCTQPLQDLEFLRPHDLVFTVSPAVLERYRAAGVTAELFHYGFDPALLERLHAESPSEPHVVFVGQLAEKHVARRAILAALARCVPLRWYGPRESLAYVDEALAERYGGEAFGMTMYRALRRGTVGWAHPPDFEPALMGMFRTFEVMGVGLPLVAPLSLVSQAPAGFERHFAPYETTAQAIGHCERLLADPAGAASLGKQGQEWVLAHRSSKRAVRAMLATMRGRLQS